MSVLAIRLLTPFFLFAANVTPCADRHDDRLQYYSNHFAVLTRGDGSKALAFLRDDGSIVETLSLEGRVPAFGLDVVAVLERNPAGPERSVETRDALGKVIARFSVPTDREMFVGNGSIALRPRADHSVGTEHRVELRSLSGIPLGATARSGVLLVALDPGPRGTWLSYAVNGNGQYLLLFFDSAGRVLWEFETRGARMPTVAVSPSLASAAIGVPQDDAQTSRLHLLDAFGAVVAETNVDEFRVATFSPDGRLLALGGNHSLTLVPVDQRIPSWSTAKVWLPLENPLCFSPDGRLLHVVSRRLLEDGGEGPPSLLAFPIRESAGSGPRVLPLSVDVQDEVLAVVQMVPDAGGGLTLVTRYRMWSLKP